MISVLSREQIQAIHEASLTILAEVGVQIPHEKAMELLAESGASVDREAQRVRFPEQVVSNALKSCGKEFTLYGRDRSKTAMFGAGSRNYNTSAGQALWMDEETLSRRYATLEDVATAARFADALPRITVVGPMSDPHELPREYRCVVVAAELIKNTTKPITFWFHDRASAKFVLEVFTAVAGSEAELARHPIAYPFLEPISPLKFPKDGIDLLFETCRIPLPVPIGPMAQTGATAPGTLASTLAQENAEILAGLCVTQAVRPGTPVCYGGIPHAFDMRSMEIIFGGPEQALMAVAMTQMGKFYGLPVYINVGLTDSKRVDAQAGLESGVTLALGALAGADIFGHLGIAGMDQGASLATLVLQHEIIGYIERLVQGIAVSPDKLALDVIRSVGPGGNFVAEAHTAEHFREELWFPELLDRSHYEIWRQAGKKDMVDRCIERRNAILEKHTVEPVSDDIGKEMDRVLADAKRHLAPDS